MKKLRILIAIICSAAAVIIAAIAIYAMTRLDTPQSVPSPSPGDTLSTATPTPTPAPTPTHTSAPEPTPTPDSTAEPTPTPTPEPTPVPTPEPTSIPDPIPQPSDDPEIAPEPTPEPEPEPEKFKLSLIGGVSPNGRPKNYDMFGAVSSLIQDDDLTIMNLESVLSDVAAPVISEAHMAYVAWAKKFRDAGIDVVNIANTHVYGCGAEGYADTVSSLNNAIIPYVGNREMTLYISKGGLLIGIYASNGGAGSNMKKSITAMQNAGADLIIVCLTWNAGTTNLYMSNEYLSARYAVNCGADIVLGHNGVVLHHFETYNDALIIYGLGEYAGGYDISESAVVLQLTMERGENGLYISETTCIPIKPGDSTTPPQALPAGSDEYNKIIHTLYTVPYMQDSHGHIEESGEEADTGALPETVDELTDENSADDNSVADNLEEVENGN